MAANLVSDPSRTDMLNLYMTRYDYDYNRYLASANCPDSARNEDTSLSGEVRNRPIFRFGLQNEPNQISTQKADYISHSQSERNLTGILRAACTGGERVSSFSHERSLPGLTKHFTEDGSHPNTIYKTDYVYTGRPSRGKPQLYAGARSAVFNSDFLLIPVTEGQLQEDARLAPKITSKESLLYKSQLTGDTVPRRKEGLLASRRPQLTTGGDKTDYSCTSWVYGDESLVYPCQLPCGLAESQNGHLIGNIEDKAKLLSLLSGKEKVEAKSVPILDRTNPIYIHKSAQPFCGVTRRLENEGHVNVTVYQGDFVQQSLLPDLPDAVVRSEHDKGADGMARSTCAGDMHAGSLTKYTRSIEGLRNSHGYLLKKKPEETLMSRQTWKLIRDMEKRIDVDKVDPHRHKLR